MNERLVFEDEMFALEQSAECPLPGYLILRLKSGETSVAQLPAETARALGAMLARATAAIEQAVGAERVYVLSFCEVEPRLHFHLFPRTAWLLKEYHKANFNANEAIDGPMLFSWARSAFGPGSRTPKGTPDIHAVCASIGTFLEAKE
jgi:Diadenosine tetraphosphate (Ap4A) hydrolase and other HIT family hydrolases